MNEFIEYELGEVANIGMGQSPPSSSYNSQERGLPFLQGCSEFGPRHPRPVIYCDNPGRIAPKNSILISVRAPVGTLNIADLSYCIGRGLGYVEGRTATTQYLYYLLAILRPKLERCSQGSTFEAINSSELRQLCVSIPPLPEQRKIALILGTLDELIERTEALIAKYESIRQGLMHDLFTRGLTEQGHLRPPQSQAPNQYKKSELGWIPKDWEVSTVGSELLGIDAGKSPDCPDIPATPGEWGVLKVSAVQPDGFRSEENKIIINPALVNPLYEVHDGDLLISRSNTYQLVGIVSLVRSPQPQLMMCDKTLRLRFNSQRSVVEFMFWLLQQHPIRKQIEIHATGTSGSMKNISQSAIRSLQFKLPPVDEQEQIVERIQSLQATISDERQKSAKLSEVKAGLMQDLLTGKVRVKIEE